MRTVTDERAVWLAKNVLPHEPALRAWLERRKVQDLEVDDIIQETYAVLVELESVGHIRNPRTYAFSIAHSIILQHVRRLRIVSIEAMAELDRLSIYCEEATPERRAGDYQELRRIAGFIAALPDKCREAFTLRKIEGLSQREVARRMGVSENTIEKHIGKALRILMAEIGKDEAPSSGLNADVTERRGRHGRENQ